MRISRKLVVLSLFLSAAAGRTAAGADEPAKANPSAASADPDGVAFFEKNVRPVLADQCYSCHSAAAKKVKGGLLLDSKQGIAKGGDGGAILVAGQPDKSRFIEAVRWTDPDLHMPPKTQLTPQQIEKLELWVKMGAPDPRDDAPAAGAGGAKKPLDVEAGRAWWAFQPVRTLPPPAVAENLDWGKKKKIDAFLLAKLRENKVDPSPAADRRTLVRRATLDLTGLRPTYDEVEAFAADPTPDAYDRLVDKLLASPRYGERWGRYWLDVARYGEDNPTSEATNPPYPFAWRYRDWVIGAVNDDVPYDRFVKLQLAADLTPGAPRKDLAALGFLGAGPVYHKDGRLSRDVIETLYTDDWDERVDTVTRGVLGLTVACARCHDHKFDPILTRDYYSLAGVFASTVAAPRPVADIDPAAETKFMAAAQRIFYLSYVANLLRTEPGSKPKEAREKVERYTAEMDRVMGEMAFLREGQPGLYAYLDQLAKRPNPYPAGAATRPAGGARAATTRPAAPAAAANAQRGRRGGGSTEPFYNAVYDAGLWVDGSDADLTMTDVKPGTPRDLPVFRGGNVAKPGEPAPRQFVSVLAKGDPVFHNGSGRQELADKMFTDAAPLAARVIVNRVWGWHFGQPLVATPSDFGVQGEKPTHPELLDDLAARFIESGWSMKWLHREIMLSAAYRQASRPRPDGMRADPTNRLVWRMNPRRLDVEAYRDCLLQAAGGIDETMGGPSGDLDGVGNNRRSVYARVSRGRLSNLLQLYDFPEAAMHSPGRVTTTTPLQQLFILNSPFMQDRAAKLADGVGQEPDVPTKIRAMYRKVLSRDPDENELRAAARYLETATLPQYAQALLCTNEVIFWP